MREDTDSQEVTQRLGYYLRQEREKAGLTSEAFCRQTRISSVVVKAMENGDYQSLPAHAFARGLYSLYAKTLGLNDERIVNWYNEERQQVMGVAEGGIGGSAIYAAPATHRMASAERSRPLVTLVILLVILAFIAAIICWRFEVKPIAIIREKIHLVQERSQSRPRHFRIPDTSKVIRRADEKKKTPLVTLSAAH